MVIQAYTILSTEMYLSQLKAHLDCVDLALFQNRIALSPGDYLEHCDRRTQVNLVAADLFLTELFAELHLTGGVISKGRTFHTFMGVCDNPEQYVLPTSEQRQRTRYTDRWDNPNHPETAQSAPCTPSHPRTPRGHRHWHSNAQSSPADSPDTPKRGNCRHHPYSPSSSSTRKPRNVYSSLNKRYSE